MMHLCISSIKKKKSQFKKAQILCSQVYSPAREYSRYSMQILFNPSIFLLYFFHYHLPPLHPLPPAITTLFSMSKSPFSLIPPPANPLTAVSLLSISVCLYFDC